MDRPSSVLQHINQADRTLLSLNLLFLLFITLIPFMTVLMIKYPGTFVVVAFFALAQAITGIIIIALWYYATKGRRLSDPDLSAVTVLYYMVRGILGAVAYLISIVIAFFNAYVAQLSWLFIGQGVLPGQAFGYRPVTMNAILVEKISAFDFSFAFTHHTKARYPPIQHFPGSLTRNLYRKKIPEIMNIVDMVP